MSRYPWMTSQYVELSLTWIFKRFQMWSGFKQKQYFRTQLTSLTNWSKTINKVSQSYSRDFSQSPFQFSASSLECLQPELRRKSSWNISPINQNIKIFILLSTVSKNHLKPILKRRKCKMRINSDIEVENERNSWDLLVSPFHSPIYFLMPSRTAKIARRYLTPLQSRVLHSAESNDDASDKKSHSFIAASRLISIRIRLGIR
jgi:hypothetical protein